MKNHIIFDMDGVIIDSEPEYQKRIKIFMGRNGFTITDELSFQICGSNRKDTYELLQENVPDFVMSYEAYNKGRDQVNAEYPLNLRAIVNEDIYPLMKKLKASGFHIGMASSAPKEKILQNLGVLELTDYFDIIVSGQEFVHSKPDPEIYQKACESLGIQPEYCMAFEDAPGGILSAHQAGMQVIMVPDLVQPTQEIRELTHRVCDSLADVIGILN